MIDQKGRLIDECQSCKSKNIVNFLSLGKVPIANEIYSFNLKKFKQISYPLDLLFCKNCNLIQLGYEVDPQIVFPKNFPYTSSSTKALRDNFEKLSKKCRQKFKLNKKHLVVDIGSNDGNLLSFFKNYCKVLGVTPENIGKIAIKKGIPTIIDFFNRKIAKKILRENGKAKLVTSTNTFAHVPDVNGFVKAVSNILDEKGIFITESHYFLDLQKTFQYDTIYHEHLRYYSLKSLQYIFKNNNLEIFDVEKIDTHGGSIRVFACNKNTYSIKNSVNKMIENEKKYINLEKLKLFSLEVENKKNKLFELIKDLNLKKKKIFGIGAAARASTLINYVGLNNYIHKVLEVKGSKKIGFYMSGTKIPICDEEILYTEKPDYLVLLSWHISDIIIPKLRQKNFKGKFIIPLPEPKILD